MVVVVVFVTIVVVMVFLTMGREATFAGTEIFAETARFNVRAGCRCALTLDMVMVTLLWQPDFGLKSQDRGSILARRAIRRRNLSGLFDCPFGERLQDLWMVVQVPGPDKLDVRVIACAQLRKAIDSIDKDSGEQKVRENDHPSVTQPGDKVQAWLDQWKRYPGISDLAPAEPHALPEHARDLGDIAVRVRIRCPATDDNERRLSNRNGAETMISIFDGLPNPVARGQHHLGVDPKLSSVSDLESVFSCVRVEYRRNVVLRVHCGKQHARYCENAPTTPLPQAVKALSNHGVREFQVSKLEIPLGRQVRRKAPCEYGEFVDSRLATGPVSAKHHADRHVPMPRPSLGAPGAPRSDTGRPGFVIVRGCFWQFDMSPRLTQMGRNGPAALTITGYAPWLGQRDSVPLSGPEEHRQGLIMVCHDKEQSESRSTGQPKHPGDRATVRVAR